MRRAAGYVFVAAFLGGAALLFPQGAAYAASCCGGGSASALVMPKISSAMLDVSLDYEKYNGYWNKDGKHFPDPPGSDLKQYRLNIGYAYRLADNWQISAILPLVFNENKYSGASSSTRGVGDATINLWYEAFDKIMCVWKVNSWKDLIPAVYFGGSLVVPTGISPYDDAGSSFDITGRGFYRLDATMLLDKTIYPWNTSLLMSYGTHLERPINREYGTYVQPYHKKLGDRFLWTASFGYTAFLESMNTITFTGTYSDLRENEGTINGQNDPTTGMEKRSVSATAAWSSMERDWVLKLTLSHALAWSGMGSNFPTTDVVTMGVSHVFR